MSAPSSPAVEVHGLVREFKGGIRAVDGLDLAVAPGEIYGFLGPNGAGKTTSVRILTTLLRPTAGHARVAGHDVVAEADAVRRAIGVALQEAAIDPLMTGRELLRMQGALHGLRAAAARERAADAAVARRTDRGRGPPRRRLLGRDAAAARPRARARPPAARAVPRRADDRARPDQPRRAVARGARAQRRGHHRLPHHAVPGGGRAARRPRRHHRARPARRRGDAGHAQGAGGEPTLHIELADPESAERARVALAALGGLQPPTPPRRRRSSCAAPPARPRSRP